MGRGRGKQKPVAVPEVSVSNKLNKQCQSTQPVSLPSLNIYINVSVAMARLYKEQEVLGKLLVLSAARAGSDASGGAVSRRHQW